MSNNNKPTAQDNQYPQVIFTAEVVMRDGKKTVAFIYNTRHIPTLDHIVQQLSYDIIELRAMEKTKQELLKKKFLTKGPMMSLNEFLNRKRR